MKIDKKKSVGLLVLAAVLSIYAAHAMLSVTITNVGTVIGQSKELTISTQTAVGVLGAVTVLPACATALASTFADVATASLNWGATLQGGAKYETFFCIGNIGTSAGTIHVAITGAGTTGDGSTLIVQSCSQGALGLAFAALDGTSIAGGGVVAVHVELDTPTVGLNAQTALASHIAFTFS